MNKCCNRCKVEKPQSEFYRNKSKRDGLGNFCKECNNHRGKSHYSNNKQYYFDRNAESKQRTQEFIRDCKENNPCTDCGKFYPYYVMDFDHCKNDKKKANVAQMMSAGLGVVKKEIDKCELVCSNCHRIRTHQRSKV